MDKTLIMSAILPATVIASFIVHWIIIIRIDRADERLPHCRGAYLAMSFQLLIYAWVSQRFWGTGAAMWLIPLGMSFSFIGDIFNLRFEPLVQRTGEVLLWGIVSFAFAQICYIGAFISLVPIEEMLKQGHLAPLLAVMIVVPAILFRFRVYNPSRPRSIMYGAFFYGFILGAMAAMAIAAALARGGYWYAVAAGALFFLLSDAVMGETTVYGRHPRFEFQIPWFTYIISQSLILFGAMNL